MNDSSKQSFFVTGANGGLGFETCRILVQDSIGHLTMACRTDEKAQQARQKLLAATGITDTTISAVGGFDMTDPASLEVAVAKLPADHPFDVIFLQAGGVVFESDYQTVAVNGNVYERTVFQNVLGGHIILSALHKRGLIAPNSRVVAAGGEGARGLPPLIEKPEFASAEYLRQYVTGDFSAAPPYNPMNAIGVSKLMSALWVRKLAELEADNFNTIWFTPGFTYGTQGLKGVPPLRRWFMENIGFKLFALLGRAQSPQAGARKYADCLQGKIGRNGDLLGAPEGKGLGELVDQTPMNVAFSDTALQAEFWAIANDLYAWESKVAA